MTLLRTPDGVVNTEGRDSYCTPPWLTALLPWVDLDPCSNERSTVRSRRRYTLTSGEDGLQLPWDGSVFVNPPYSEILPWARKLEETEAFIVLVNVDSSTRWWEEIVCQGGTNLFLFRHRIQFSPPPGLVPSTNSRPQCLLCDAPGRRMIGGVLVEHGDWWELNG